MISIYVFSDEFCIPKYVGKTRNLQNRLKQHLYRDRFKYKSYFYNWLNKQIGEDKEFFVDILEECEESIWKEREIYWIEHIRSNGFVICNMTDGGDGNNNQIFTEESKRKRSQRMIGIKRSIEVRNAISKGKLGYKLKEETKEKLRNINLGKSCPEIVKKKLSKVVIKEDIDGKITEYSSLKEASDSINCRKGTLSNAIKRNKNGKFKDYYWRYK